MTIPDDTLVLQEYRNAIYEIYEPHILMHVGQASPELDQLLAQHDEERWAFITPYNPYPHKLTAAENEARLEELRHLAHSFITYAGEGRDDGATPCPIEKGLFILGIPPNEAGNLGQQFDQKAILVGHYGKPVELMVLK